MGKRGKATVEFDFGFEYSDGGEFCRATAIDLQAPGRGLIDVHNIMESWIGKGMVGAAKVHNDIKDLIASVDEDEAREKVKKGGGKGRLKMLSMGLDPENYNRLVKYVLKSLTNSPLAMISGTKIKLNEGIWNSLEEEGGLDAILEVVGEFIGFFEDKAPTKKKSKKKSGTASSQISA